MLSIDKNILEISKRNFDVKNVILLCSSGVDSLAMTHYFLKKKPINAIYTVIHFDHNLRPENKLMAESCSKFMELFPDDFYWSILNINKDLKTEDDFRKFRINKLKEVLLYGNNTLCITAHHLNDCVESYLLNTIRGHPEYLPIPFFTDIKGRTNIRLCKPFLFKQKKDFVDYAIKHDIYKYVVEDSTNKVVKGSRRNLMRNEIIPILERENVGLAKVVAKKMKKRLMLELIKR